MKKLIAILLCLIAMPGLALGKGRKEVTPSGLALKIVAVKGRTAIIDPVPGTGWITKFDRSNAGLQEEEESRVNVVNFKSKMQGEAVSVEVSVGKTKYLNVIEPIGTFLIHLNEVVVVNDLTRFNVAPIELSIIKVNREKETVEPTIEIHASSVQFVSVVSGNAATRTYMLELRNNSNKNLSALEVHTYQGDRKSSISAPRGEQDHPLAASGETFRIKVLSGSTGKMTDDGYLFEPITRVEIVSAVFQDDTYEGDGPSAMRALAARSGRRDQLAIIVGILRKSIAGQEPNQKKAIDALGARVASLPVEADGAVMREFSSMFPNERPPLGAMGSAYSISMNSIKKDFILDLEKFMKGNGYPNLTGDFHKWLFDAKERYQEWLDRLQ